MTNMELLYGYLSGGGENSQRHLREFKAAISTSPGQREHSRLGTVMTVSWEQRSGVCVVVWGEPCWFEREECSYGREGVDSGTA